VIKLIGTIGGNDMLGLALLFLVIAIVAAIFGFGGIAGTFAWIAQLLLAIFVILLIASLVMYFVRGGSRGI
jgi:uncharacterized membrane protein YtjA (UPF0391 family)